MITKGDIAQKVWEVLTIAYGQGATTKVEVPAEEVVEILLSVTANVLAQLPVLDRDRIARDIPPKLARLISSVRARSNLAVHARPKSGILLPH